MKVDDFLMANISKCLVFLFVVSFSGCVAGCSQTQDVKQIDATLAVLEKHNVKYNLRFRTPTDADDRDWETKTLDIC